MEAKILKKMQTTEEEGTSLLSESHVQRRVKKQKTNTVRAGYLKMRKSTFFIQTWRTCYFILKKSVLVYKSRKEVSKISAPIGH